MLWHGISLVVGALSVEPPHLARLEPASVSPYESVTLALHGRGFASGARVYIEGSQSGRFVPHSVSSLSSEICEVQLPLGFGATPPVRRVYIANPDGSRTESLELRVAHAEEGDVRVEPESPEPFDARPDASPVIDALRPQTVPPARPFVLEVLGKGFADGAVVEITVNVNAGSSRLPEYGAQRFEAVRHGEDLLEVELDRGFYPIPGLRDVVVVNPDGGRSPAMALRIQSTSIDGGER